VLLNKELKLERSNKKIKEHKYNLTQGLLEQSKSAQHTYEEGHKILWNETKVLHIE
jgi:hypothetical protein